MAEALQLIHAFRQAVDTCPHCSVRAAKPLRLLEGVRRLQHGGPFDALEEPFAPLADRALAVPIERRGERRIIAVRLRCFFFRNWGCVPTSGRMGLVASSCA